MRKVLPPNVQGAFERGRKACKDGVSVHKNPHKAMTVPKLEEVDDCLDQYYLALSWTNGWWRERETQKGNTQ